MNELSKTSLPRRLAEQDEEEWERFHVMLKYATGFWVAFVFSPSSFEATVIRERVAEMLASEGARMDVWLPQSADEMRETLPWTLSPERAGAGCVWVQALQVDGGGEAHPWEDAWAHFFLRGNEKREVFRRRLRGGLVIVAPMAMKTLVREAAPDLWSIRAIVLELSGMSVATQALPEPSKEMPATHERHAIETAPDAPYWMQEAASRQPGSEGRAYALLQAAKGWRANGRREEALAASQEAVDIYRGLAEQQPDTFEAGWAGSLNDLGNWQSLLGQREAALVSIQQAVELYRKLAQRHPEAFEAGLAGSLNNLGIAQSALGQREAALASTQQAVEIYQKLAQRHPEAFESDLAGSLNNLGNRQSELGQHEAALVSTQQAVELYRKLAQRHPETFEPDLAMSLSNLGGNQSALGQREAALISTQQAVKLYQKLAQHNPDIFEPDLAASLNNLGIRQSEMGQREAALVSTQQAVDIRRKLAQRNPDAFEPNLAGSLVNLALHLQGLERLTDARALASRAFDLYSGLHQKYPQAFRQDLGNAIALLRELYESLGTPLDETTQQRIDAFEAEAP